VIVPLGPVVVVLVLVVTSVVAGATYASDSR